MRSDYLDNLVIEPGMTVICKCDMFGSFTPNKKYTVMEQGTLIDDTGNRVVPSARFYATGPNQPQFESNAWREPKHDNQRRRVAQPA